MQAAQVTSPAGAARPGGGHWRLLAVALAVGALVPLVLHWQDWHAQQARTEAARLLLAAPPPDEEAANRLRRQIEQARSWQVSLDDRQTKPEAALQWLNQIAVALPDGLVLRRLQWQEGAWISEGRARDLASVRAWVHAASAMGGAAPDAPIDRCAARLLAESTLATGRVAFTVAGGCSTGAAARNAGPAVSAEESTPGNDAQAISGDAVVGVLLAAGALGSLAWWRTRPLASPWRLAALSHLLRRRPFSAWPRAAAAVVAAELALVALGLMAWLAPLEASTQALEHEEWRLKDRFVQVARGPLPPLPDSIPPVLAVMGADPSDALQRTLQDAVARGQLVSATLQRGAWRNREYNAEVAHRIELVGGFDAIGTVLNTALADPALRLAVSAFELAPDGAQTLRLVATVQAMRWLPPR